MLGNKIRNEEAINSKEPVSARVSHKDYVQKEKKKR